jgi:hypothetical protein
MKQHVELVGTLYMIAGGLSLLVAVSMLSLGLGAVMLTDSSSDRFAGFVPGVFVVLASMALVWSAVHLWNGWALQRYSRFARAVAVVLAGLNLFLLPFGTALGVYALWVLLNDQSRPVFGAPPS